MDFTYELEQLEEGNRDPKLIAQMINNHKDKAEKMKAAYDRYKAECLPIQDRQLDDPMNINNVVSHDYFGEIIDMKIGYFAGTPATYTMPTQAEKAFKLFATRNRLADLDAETTKYASICGYGARLSYIDENKDIRVVNIKPWQAIPIGSNGMDESDFGLRYYKVKTADGEECRAELYEPNKMTEYRGGGFGALKEYDTKTLVFNFCPLWGYENNEELIGDGDKVISEIDAYDRVVSDVNSEIEAFRMAYLAFYGVLPPDEEEEESYVKAGTFYFSKDGNGGQSGGEFITKTLQDTAIENHLNRLHDDIYRFSKTPDLSDEAFGGTVTGIAAKYKLLPLENKTATFERKFKSSSLRMFQVIEGPLKGLGITFDPFEVEMTFTRTFPEDLYSEAQATVQLKGQVSEETRLSKLSFVDNPAEELKAMKAEQEEAYQQQVKAMEDEEAIINKRLGGAGDGSTGTGSAGNTKETK